LKNFSVPDDADINQVEVFIPQGGSPKAGSSRVDSIHDQIIVANPGFEQKGDVGQVYNRQGKPEPFYGVVFIRKA